MTLKIPIAIRRQAVSAANSRALPTEPLRWSDAMVEAPWQKSLGAAFETEFRRSYAARLVARGAAAKAHQAGKSSGPSGTTELERKTVYLTRAERLAQEAKAKEAGLSWSTWARRKLAT